MCRTPARSLGSSSAISLATDCVPPATVNSASGSIASQGSQHEGAQVGQRMRQGQAVFQGKQLAVALERRQMAADQIDVEGAWAPLLPAHAIRGDFQRLRAAQPTVPVESRVVGDQHRVEERALLDTTPGRRLVDRRHRLNRVAEPVEHRLQPGQPVTEVGSDRQHDTSHCAAPPHRFALHRRRRAS